MKNSKAAGVLRLMSKLSAHFQCSLQLSASGINVPSSRTADECRHAGIDQYVLKAGDPILSWSVKWNSRPRIERDQVDLGAYPANELDQFAGIVFGIVDFIQEDVFKRQSLPVPERKITRSGHQLFQAPLAAKWHQPGA